MVAAKVEAWRSSKMMGFVRQHLFGSAEGHANKAFSTFTTELSVFTDPVGGYDLGISAPGTVPQCRLGNSHSC